jgi:dTDP-4-amino-4,6-dideoxygalactose transaminase
MRRMSPFQAGLSRRWKEKLKEFRSARERNSEKYLSLLSQSRSSDMEFGPSAGVGTANLIRFPLLVKDSTSRDKILNESEKQGLGIMPGYPDSINHVNELKDQFREESYPAAEQTARTLITLPVHPYVKDKDIKKIIQLIAEK